jgi:hypothetical protein
MRPPLTKDPRPTSQEGFELPTEEQLRLMITPEDVCCFEATQAGVDRLHLAGITAQLVVTSTPQQLASAITQLPDDPLVAQVRAHFRVWRRYAGGSVAVVPMSAVVCLFLT